MKKLQKILLLLTIMCMSTILSFGQTTRDSLVYTPINVTTSVSHDTSYMVTKPVTHDTTWQTVRVDTIKIPIVEPSTYIINSMYVSPIEDWIASPDVYLSWAKKNGVNELNLYARTYITSASKNATLATFIKKAKEQYGIKKVFVDYRLTSEIPAWQNYVNKYKGTTSNVDGMITEREPYVTGDYAGFWPFLRQGKAFTKLNGLLFSVYMGQPTQQGWDSICYYTDRVYLSLYITMATWNNSSNGYNYVAGRWGYMANSNTKTGRKDMPVVYIISLERKIWGAGNDFMGLWFVTNPFYGSTWNTELTQYNKNASTTIKSTTELVGSCIFYSKYAKLAKPLN